MLPWWNPKNKILCHIDIFFQSSAMINYMKMSFLAEALKKTGFKQLTAYIPTGRKREGLFHSE